MSTDGSQDVVGILRALRYRADEVQLGRVLHAVCQDEPVASQFVSLVLDAAAGNPELGERAKQFRASIPTVVLCSERTHIFADVGRASLRKRTRAVGAVDLLFTGAGGWKLLVELKIDSGFGPRQRERYLQTRQPLVAIVRRPRPLGNDSELPQNWLGAVAWSTLLPGLRSLKIRSDAERQLWLNLLRLIDDDGDFSEAKPSDITRALAVKSVLDEIQPELTSALRGAIARKHGPRGKTLAAAMIANDPAANRDGWASFGILFADDPAPAILVAVREIEAPAPLVRVWWVPPGGVLSRRRLSKAHEHLRRHSDFEPRPGDEFLFETLLPATEVRERGIQRVLEDTIRDALLSLVDSGALAQDL